MLVICLFLVQESVVAGLLFGRDRDHRSLILQTDSPESSTESAFHDSTETFPMKDRYCFEAER